MKKRLYGIILILFFIATIGYQFYLGYTFRTAPPSNVWSKGVLISSGNVKNYTRLLEYKGNYIVAHDDEDKIKLLLVDRLGKKLDEREYPAGDVLFLKMNLLSDENNIYVNWITSSKGVKYLNNMKLDGNLNIIEQWKVEGVIDSAQINNNTMAIAFKDRIEIYGINNERKVSVDVISPTLLSGAVTDMGYIISYWENESSFKYFFVKDGKASDIKLAADVTTPRSMTFTRSAVEMEGKTGYIIVEAKTTSEFGVPKYIEFTIDGEEHKNRRFKLDYYGEYAFNPLGVSSTVKPSDEGARFLISYQRLYGLREIQIDILDLTYKNGEIIKTAYMTNKGTTMMYPAIYGDTAVYCEYVKEKQFNIYMTSQNESFKSLYNGTKSSEVSMAMQDTALGLANSSVYLFTLGIRWITLAGVIISVIGLFSYKFNHKSLKKAFVIVYAISGALKTYIFYDMFYKEAQYPLPHWLSNNIVGLGVCILISVMSCMYGLEKYKSDYRKNSESLVVLGFALSIVIDAFLTQLVFVPFIP